MKKRQLYSERIQHALQKAGIFFLAESKKISNEAKVRKHIFSQIALEKRWGDNISGGGSSLEFTKHTRKIILDVINNFEIKSLLDVACGDFVWMPLVLNQLQDDFKFIGCDIVSELIQEHKNKYSKYDFFCKDFVNDKLPVCDLILCRDALQHLSIQDIKKALKNFSNSGAKYLLATTHIRYPEWKNKRDIRTGQCRDRNLILKPFNMADPITIYSEQNIGNKFLGLWELPVKYCEV